MSHPGRPRCRGAAEPRRAPRRKETKLKSCIYRVSLALTALALLGLAVPGRAQQPSTQNLVPFKAAAVVTTDSIMIPLTPPIVATRVAYSSGQSDLLGP